ncbi:MAG: preprotein translocase subunit SecA [Bacillota bacterium]|nr:preprotein translocase subunit SecA [Bacillota bacterium]
MKFIEKIFGSHSSRELKRIDDIVESIEALEDQYKALSESELKGKTEWLKGRLEAGETLDDILPAAFATVREASWRVLGMRHFRVQLIGGIVLHQGRISEMKTGEGKTLVATLPAYLNALTGKGVHIVTVNDYLAKRDSEWMGKVYRYLGLSVGLVIHGVEDRKSAYNADITYGTNNEFGFDYLRDNMVTYREFMVQRGHNFAIVDEVDSILIDEARTPLIISGVGEESTEMYQKADNFVKRLRPYKVLEEDSKELLDDVDADYIIDEKGKNVSLTKAGIKKAEEFFNVEILSDQENTTLVHHINQALRAHGIMKRDVDYVIKDGEIIIVDEFTGRLMFGRRYSQGLHQAIEAKEHVMVQNESKTLATITFQNYFRLYDKLSGMTGTALTEETEFREIYGLDVIEIPTNKPMVRKDYDDEVYKTENGKFNAVVKQIKVCHEKGQPVLVGTISIEKSETLSHLLGMQGIKHNVLNAKQHEREAEIVAQAGKKGAVTIATNMAGRGTDIILGGNAEFLAKNEMRKQGYTEELINVSNSFGETDNPDIIDARKKYSELNSKFKEQIKAEADEVCESGGLFIIGTERHESRRIDNQLRGRAGRQGDPGASRFYISLEDDLMRLFGSERVQAIVEKLGMDDETPIAAGILSNSIETAQKRVEGKNFDIRKNVLQYDDVMNKQREVIYGERKKVLDGENLHDNIISMIKSVIATHVSLATGGSEITDDWKIDELRQTFIGLFLTPEDLNYHTIEQLEGLTKDDLIEELEQKALKIYDEKEQKYGNDVMRELERVVLLQCIDKNWMDHIDAMDDLRSGVSLRAYGQQDPVIEYKFESYDMFEAMTDAIKEDTVRLIYLARIKSDSELRREKVARETGEGFAGDEKKVSKTVKNNTPKVGRNDPCPCGSGKKYKKCCGA